MSDSPLAMLNQFCTQHDFHPSKQFLVTGPEHLPLFQCAMTLQINGKKLQAISDFTNTKKASENNAANRLFEQIKSSTEKEISEQRLKEEFAKKNISMVTDTEFVVYIQNNKDEMRVFRSSIGSEDCETKKNKLFNEILKKFKTNKIF